MSKQYKSLSTTNEPVDLSISDIVDGLKEDIRLQISMLDRGTADIILNADDELLDLILAEYDSQLLWNLSNTILGKGILIGMLIGSITQYFEQLQRAENEDETEYFESTQSLNSNEDDEEIH